MHWPLQADFSFGLAAGYVGAFPESYMRYGAWRDLLGVPLGAEGVPSLAELRRFVADKGVTVLVVERDHPEPGRRVFRSLAGPPVETGGGPLYPPPPPPRPGPPLFSPGGPPRGVGVVPGP